MSTSLVATITPATTGKETPLRNRMTEKNHPKAHPSSRRSRPDSGLVALVYLVYLVYLVCLVCLVYLVEPDQLDELNKPDRPDQPDQPVLLLPPVSLLTQNSELPCQSRPSRLSYPLLTQNSQIIELSTQNSELRTTSPIPPLPQAQLLLLI